MRISGPSNVIACIPLLIGMMLQSPPVTGQAPGPNPRAAKEIYDPAAAMRAKQAYVRPPATQAVLTLTADNLVPKPNEDVNFKLAWDRNVPSFNYHFDWADKTSDDTTAPTATHRYAGPGVYHVRVTATLNLSAERMMILKAQGISVQSNEVTINVPKPVQPPPPTQSQPPPTTIALTADTTSVKQGDPVNFTAILNPPSDAALFHFDFGDGYTIDTPSNLTAHNYSLPGPHSATVALVDANGNQQANSPPVEVTVLEPVPPHPVVQLTPLFQGTVVAGQPISVLAALNPSTPNTGFVFDWGDGTLPQTVDSQGLGTHTYTKSGSMDVVVTALTNEAYVPPLQSLPLPVQIDPKNWWPPSLGEIVAAGGALIVIAVIAWLIFKPDPLPRTPPTPPTPKSQIVHQQFQYQVSRGWSHHDLHMASPSSSIGPLKLSSRMGPEEHRIKFPGRTDTSN